MSLMTINLLTLSFQIAVSGLEQLIRDLIVGYHVAGGSGFDQRGSTNAVGLCGLNDGRLIDGLFKSALIYEQLFP